MGKSRLAEPVSGERGRGREEWARHASRRSAHSSFTAPECALSSVHSSVSLDTNEEDGVGAGLRMCRNSQDMSCGESKWTLPIPNSLKYLGCRG